MQCNQCGVCCTEISISIIQKPAGVRCRDLTEDNKCGIYGQPQRPAVCSSFQADPSICGSNGEEATKLIRWYEKETRP